ncbi:hypothetical protein KVV02_003105 [Mortierella alpina]|uniref:TRP C-terminal domain-containing protein n=1 Tax=Mortierella alpina TaxID=64518 RepID=A0A9P7ZX08_MORAP|nr:hypothetical protein KVV02_003105 [Mortierella alpina]
MLLQGIDAWPYVDCAGPNPIFSLQRVVAHYDRSNNSIGLLLQGNFTDTYWAQGYSAAATSQWRTSIQTTIMGTQLYRSEGPACMHDGGMIIGGCPTAPGFGTIQTSFNNVSQAAPFAELMVAMQIIGSNNQSIVCVAVLLEQTMTEVNTAISLLPLALALFSGAISLVATIMRASIGSGFLGAVASYGLPTEAVSVHTPGLFDIIFYTQFMVMTGQLTLNYPSFYSTFTALFHWSFLQFKDTLVGKGPANATEVLTFQGSGSVNQMRAQIYVPGNHSQFAFESTSSIPSSTDVRKRSLAENIRKYMEQAPLPAIGTPQAAALLTYTKLRPTPVSAEQLKRRQDPLSESVSTFSPPPSPSPSPSPSDSEPAFTSTTSSSSTKSTSSSSSSSSSRSRSIGVRPTPPPSRTPPPNPTASSTTPALVIPTITDPFTNTSAGTEQYNVSRFGIESYAAAIGAFPSTLFLGTLINAALAAVGTLVLSAMLLVMAWVKAKENHQKGKTLQHALNFVAGNLIRLWSLLYTPLALTAMYQLTIAGGAGLTTGAAASLLIFSVSTTVFFTWRVLRASSDLLLFDDLGTLLKYGTLYNTLSLEGTLFFLVTLLARFLWGLAVTMLSSFGVAQVAVLLVVEFGYMLVIAIKWPFSQSGDNKFHLFLSILRIAITGCSIAYIHSLEASPEMRQLFAYIQMALHLAVFIVIFALSLWNLIQVCIFWKTRHSDSWKGPTKTYNFDDPIDGSEQGWGMSGRPLSSGGGSHIRQVQYGGEDDDDSRFSLVKTRRFTVQSYSSLGSSSHSARGASMRHTMHGSAHPHMMQQHQQPLEGSDDDLSRFGSPAERYRQSRLTDHRRSRLAESDTAVSPTEESLLERRLDALTALTANTAPAAGANGLVTPSSTLLDPSSDTEASNKINPRLSMANTVRSSLPQRESYANLQRMSHQLASPDPRTRRMSDITRDGPYLYNPRKDEKESASQAMAADSAEPSQSLWSSMKTSIGNAFGRFGKRSAGSPSTDGSKPKAFEVMRPPRRTYEDASERPASRTGSVAMNDETGSQVGGDRLRELNTLGISRFFQESDRGYERNRNLFVANPSAMISRTGSLVSTISGAVGPTAATASMRLNRNGSGTAESVRTLQQARAKGPVAGTGSGHTLAGVGAGVGVSDRASLLVGGGGGGGIDSPRSEYTGTASISDRDSRRTSSALMIGTGSGSVNQLYPPRHSVESSQNIADALTIESPLLLQGGGILKVSRGPEKAVQYWHKESGQYVELSAEALKDQQSPQQRKVPATTAGGEMGGAGIALEGSHSPPAPKQLLPPSIRTQKLPQTGSSSSIRTSSMAESSMGSGGPNSGANSPTESQSQSQPSPSPSTNVAASAGRMHEILGRMFSDRSVRLTHSDHEQDADSILSEDTASTFSGRYSIIGRRSLLQQPKAQTPHSPNQTPVQTRFPPPPPQQQHEHGTGALDQGEVTPHWPQPQPQQQQQQQQPQQLEDTQSVLGYDMLEPVMEDSDLDEPDLTPRQLKWDPLDVEGFRAADGLPKVTIFEPTGTAMAPEETIKRASSASSTMMEKRRPDGTLLTRTFSGPHQSSSSASGSGAGAGVSLALRASQPKVKRNPLSGRPLQQPAHPSPLIRLGSPQPGQHLVSTASTTVAVAAAGASGTGELSRHSSVQSGTSSRLEYLDAHWLDHNPYDRGEYDESALNRNASIATTKTEASYVTAMSQYPSDDEHGEDD